MKFEFVRNGEVAVPLDKVFYKKIKDKAVFVADVKIVRNPLLHRKLWKLFRFTWYHLPEHHPYKTLDSLREELIFQAGYFTKSVLPSGEEIYKVQSIAYENMEQLEFEELYARVLDEVCRLLGLKVFELSEELEAFE